MVLLSRLIFYIFCPRFCVETCKHDCNSTAIYRRMRKTHFDGTGMSMEKKAPAAAS